MGNSGFLDPTVAATAAKEYLKNVGIMGRLYNVLGLFHYKIITFNACDLKRYHLSGSGLGLVDDADTINLRCLTVIAACGCSVRIRGIDETGQCFPHQGLVFCKGDMLLQAHYLIEPVFFDG